MLEYESTSLVVFQTWLNLAWRWGGEREMRRDEQIGLDGQLPLMLYLYFYPASNEKSLQKF
jgi:hypothetical protein